MTDRERLLAIMAGHSPDRIPWIPRLEIWHRAHLRRGTLPSEFEGLSLREIEHRLGVGTPARNGRVFRTELRGVEVRTEDLDNALRTVYITPLGRVSTLQRRSSVLHQGGINTELEVEHMIKRVEDYPIVEYIVEHTDVIPTYQEYEAYVQEIGDDGVPLVSAGPDPMYRFLRNLVGFNDAFYHMADYPRQVEHLLAVLTEHARQVQRVVLDSPARLILHGEHFDSQTTPPYLFRQYMVPYFQAFADALHARDKLLVCHADADTSLLLDLIVEAGFDMAECFVTTPMVPVTLAQARAAFGTRVIIWGGIPSVILCDPVTDREFERYVLKVFRTIAPGDAFILGVADNVMAEARIERVRRVSELVHEYGRYPIQVNWRD